MADTEFITLGGDAGSRDLTAAKTADPAGLGLAAGKSYRVQNISEGKQVYWRVTAAALSDDTFAALADSLEGFVLPGWRHLSEDRPTIALDANEHLYFYGPFKVRLAVQNA